MRQLSQTMMVLRSPHTGRPIQRELNTVYGYYATAKFLSETEYAEMLKQPAYVGPVHEAEKRHRASLYLPVRETFGTEG